MKITSHRSHGFNITSSHHFDVPSFRHIMTFLPQTSRHDYTVTGVELGVQ